MAMRWRLAIFSLAFAFPVYADVLEARYGAPTTRYQHGVLGDTVEYGALILTLSSAGTGARAPLTITLPDDRVFEDLAPRLVDVDLDGDREVIVIETAAAFGAQLAIYDESGEKIAATPHIGRSYRWLAPVGAADLDGDGFVEIAYIDRPHLVKTLRVWRYIEGTLVEVASAPGLTNHKIGEDFITSGLRDCGTGPEMVTVNDRWTKVMASRLVNGQIESRAIASFWGIASVVDTLNCR
ncbi:MAG: FG-GAP repeat domain-containing protein [Paracoccaceae bacterium]